MVGLFRALFSRNLPDSALRRFEVLVYEALADCLALGFRGHRRAAQRRYGNVSATDTFCRAGGVVDACLRREVQRRGTRADGVLEIPVDRHVLGSSHALTDKESIAQFGTVCNL